MPKVLMGPGPLASSSASGQMSAIDKNKLDAINIMVGATSGTDGVEGLVPAPTDGDTDKFLRGDGTWSEPNVNVWDAMSLNKETATYPTDDVYVIGGESVITDNRVQYKVTSTPTGNAIPKYDVSTFLRAGTPPPGDATEKVATTSFVSNALGGVSGIQINKSATLPMKTIVTTDNYEIYPIQQMILGIEHTQDLHKQTQPWIAGTYINLVDIADFTVTESTVKTIGTFDADSYILSFYINSTTTVPEVEEGEEEIVPVGGTILIKADDVILETLTINANANERKIFSFTLQSAKTITLTISSEDDNYSYVISKIQMETSEQVSNYVPYENICPITSGYTQCNVLHRAKNLWNTSSPVRIPGYYNNDGTFTQAENWRPTSISCAEDDVITIYGSHFKDIITLWNDSTFVDYTTDTTITIPEGVNRIIVCGLNTTSEDQIYCNEHTYEYEFPLEAGTVHGGQLTLTPDGEGILISNYNIGSLASLTWTYDSTNDVFVADCFVDQKLPASNMFKGIAYCSNLPVIAASGVLAGNLGLGITSDGKYYVHYRGMGTDATAFTTAMTGQTIYYETATTSTYNMSSLEVITSFPGYNSFTSNTGTIRRIDYVANTTGMINTADKLKLNALDLDTQASINHDVTLKADKVLGATNGNFAMLNASGNLVDSGHKHSDYLTSFTETDPTVPAWAKVTTPPYYTKPSSGIPATDLEETYLTTHQDISGKANSADLAAVAISGDYDDLSNTPEEIDPYKVVSTPADVVTITDGADQLPVKELKIAVEPMQDLHGYENPWPAGGGKNLFHINASSDTVNNVTFTVGTDGTVSLSGTASADTTFNIGTFDFKNGFSYVLNGCPASGSISTYLLSIAGVGYDAGSGYSYTPASDNTGTIRISVYSGTNVTGKVFKPMIRLSTVSDATFAPYSNICPISGWVGANVTRTGKNLFDKSKATIEKYINGDVQEVSNVGKSHSELIPVKPLTAYFMNGFGNNSIYSILALDANKQPITWYGGASKNEPFTAITPDNCRYVYLNFNIDQIDTMAFYEGNANDGYIPYQGNTYSITFPQAAGTVYGGTLTVNKDGSGELVVDRAYKQLTATSGSLRKVGVTSVDAFSFDNSLTTNPANYPDAHVIADRFVIGDVTSNANKVQITTTNNVVVSFVAGTFADVDAFKSYLSNNHIDIVYTLATHVTYSLTPGQVKTMLGVNNIWADTGKINRLEYPHETTGLIGTHDKVKLDLLPSPILSGDQNKFLAGDGTWKQSVVILAYGVSTYQDFVDAFNTGAIVYCKVPADVTDPTDTLYVRYAALSYANLTLSHPIIEFLYYRARNHSLSRLDDETWIYTLNENSEWSYRHTSVGIREVVISGDGISTSWSSQVLTFTTSPFTGATSLAAGTGGMVPAPTTADVNKFLCSDGTWATVSGGSGSSNGILGITLASTTLTADANGIVNIPAMGGCTSSTAGSAGAVPAPAAGDENKFLSGDGTWKAGGLPMVILSYGSSTWQSFIDAYNNNVIVYCRASSNSNPAEGSQTRMAFMAYVDNASNPTEVEFQYYRSVSSHTSSNMCDQVFVYKLNNAGTWSVTSRYAGLREIINNSTSLSLSYNSNKITITDA